MKIHQAVTLVGGYGLGNFGDDLLMVANLTVLGRVFSLSEVCVLGHQKINYCENLVKGPVYVARQGNVAIHSDFVIYGGGTQFFSFDKKKRAESSLCKYRRIVKGLLDGSVPFRRIWKKVLCEIEVKSNAKTAFMCIGLGPFHAEAEEMKTVEKLSGAHLIIVRDDLSYQFCKGRRIIAQQNADIIYAKNLWLQEGERADVYKENRKLTFIPRHWAHDASGRHFDSMIKLALKCKDNNFNTAFLIFDKYNDASLVNEIRKHGFRIEIWDPCESKIEDFARHLQSSELIVTARAHGAIVGATFGIPSLCVEVEPKLKIMASQLKTGAECWPQPFDADIGYQKINLMLKNYNYYKRGIMESFNELSVSANQAANKLELFLRENK